MDLSGERKSHNSQKHQKVGQTLIFKSFGGIEMSDVVDNDLVDKEN
jgi:hypothetical protein